MSFNYDRNKHNHGDDSFWTSYSDLFLGLSTIFLLLYVVASLRTGTDAIKAQVDNQKLTMQVSELESQLKMYEAVKSDYLEQNASKSELQEYQELMDKLTLLKDEAKTDQEKLARQALENERKAEALNKYQQLVRNVINANKVAKTKLIARNDIIEEQSSEIDTLETDVTTKEKELKVTRSSLEHAQSDLQRAKADVERAFKQHKLTRQQYEAKTRQLVAESEATQARLRSEAEAKERQIREESEARAAKLRAEGEARAAQLRAQGEAEANRLKAEGAEKLARVKAEGDAKITGLEGQLAKAREEADARRAIAREIKKGFASAGVKADVDMQTGEVVLDFGDNYFESDSAALKPQMRDVIERAMPAYSKSLFGNQKIADKISSVEIIGFASPTYRGRFVDPRSEKTEDKNALKYNMDLSYRRAKSIFNHLVEDKNAEFSHRKDLMSLMKVSGRSFLEVMKLQERSPANAAEFCRVNDCRKAQKVIVRFSMDGKGK